MGQNKEIYIYGLSGHGKVVADIAIACGYTIAGWIDDGDNTAPNWDTFIQTHTSASIALGIGNNTTRSTLMQKIVQMGFHLPPIVHPSAIISPSVIVKQGTVVMPLCVINADAKIGKGVIINSASLIEHDCIIEDYVHISPNVALAGGVRIGQKTHVGIASAIIQNITIGENSIIGAGSVVIHDIASNSTAVGVPCKPISS